MKVGTKILKGVLRALSALPLGFHYAWAGFFAWILRDIMHYRADVVMTNIARAFPERGYHELKEVYHNFYRQFGRLIAETIWFGGCRDTKRLHDRHLVEHKNFEVCEKAFENSPGVIILDSHFGNWELIGGCFLYDYRPDSERMESFGANDFIVVYKPLSSKMWDEIMRENRCAPVMKDGYDGYVSSNDVLRYAINHRNEKKAYVFLTDQCPYQESTANEVVDFMHQKTRTMLGGASIAHKFGYAVLYMAMTRVPEGHYEWTFKEVCADASRMTPHEIMQRYYNLLQEDLEKVPWNYLWSHKRWK